MVAENITHYRKRAGHTMRSLAEVMTTNGHPTSHSVISQIENGSRRIDVDELVVIATYTDTSAVALLTPRTDSPDDIVGDSVFPKASAREVIARNFRQPVDLPDWIEEDIGTYTGTRWRYQYQALQTLERLQHALGTDDIEMLLAIARGQVQKDQWDHESEESDGDR